MLPYKEQERLLKAAKEIGKKEGLKAGEKKGVVKGRKAGKQEGRAERELEMARVLKAKGVKAEVIAQATGLRLAEVKKLKP